MPTWRSSLQTIAGPREGYATREEQHSNQNVNQVHHGIRLWLAKITRWPARSSIFAVRAVSEGHQAFLSPITTSDLGGSIFSKALRLSRQRQTCTSVSKLGDPADRTNPKKRFSIQDTGMGGRLSGNAQGTGRKAISLMLAPKSNANSLAAFSAPNVPRSFVWTTVTTSPLLPRPSDPLVEAG
jgi:hypothetical protein